MAITEPLSVRGWPARGASQTQTSSDGHGASVAYQSVEYYDEMFDGEGNARPECQRLFQRMRGITRDDLVRRQRAADRSMVQLGITFNVYGDAEGRERIIPFDIVPRIVSRQDWETLERGL